MEESRLLFEISEDIVAKENVSADDLQDYLENPYHVKGTIFVVCMKGSIEVTLNYGRYIVRENDYITLLDNSFYRFITFHQIFAFHMLAFLRRSCMRWSFLKKHLIICLLSLRSLLSIYLRIWNFICYVPYRYGK